MVTTDTIIIGASAAGLACAACLKKADQDFILIEQHDQIAHAWRNHYDRLHLHTDKFSSDLPYFPFPKSFPKYPSRDQVVAYLELYAKAMELQPVFNARVEHLEKNNGYWVAQTNHETYQANHVIICTGNTQKPSIPYKEGIDSFPGKIMHSSAYKNGKEFKGQDVLVVGFGNSGCEIAICIHEHGGRPSLSVRSAVNVIPRDILGIPITQIAILQSRLPAKLVDMMNKPLLDLMIGDITKLGLKKLAYGPIEQIRKYQKIPLLDVGTLRLIKAGKINVFPDIKAIDGNIVHFENGQKKQYDAIVMATGYDTGLSDLVKIEQDMELNKPIRKRKHMDQDNLHFCGFHVTPGGMLREIRIEAIEIAKLIKTSKKQPSLPQV